MPLASYSVQRGSDRSEFEQKLTAAHSRIEKVFLDGGALLVSVMEILNGLADNLDRLTGILDGETTTQTVAELRRTISDLAALPERAAARQSSFTQISDLCDSTAAHVQEMLEIIRYLKTFAVTVKITGAGLAEFSGFADEIRERIQSGATEIDRFANQLATMRGQLDTVRSFSDGILADFSATIPAIVRSLQESSEQLAKQHQTMARTANEVKAVTRTVQSKIGTVLSALQIGDITRQRIEHIQSGFVHLNEFLDAGGLPDASLAADLRQIVLHLGHAQLEETLNDFRTQCGSITANMASFTSEAAHILHLRDDLNQSGGNDDTSLLHRMAHDISHACELSKRVQERSQESDSMVASVTHSAQSLQAGIEIIRAIKTDIHYMALNSNLRCSRLGDAGRSVNVVSGELRSFAAKLEAPADNIVNDMRHVEEASSFLANDDSDDIDHIDEPLNAALNAIRAVAADMDKGLADFNREGDLVFSRITETVRKLDFETALGGVLEECLRIARTKMQPLPATVLDLALSAQSLSERIYAIYTMQQERDIHQKFLPVDVTQEVGTPQLNQTDEDDDLFAAALF